VTSGEFVQDIARQLALKGVDVKYGEQPTRFSLVGYRSQFRPLLMTKINLFTVVAEADAATADTIEEFTSRSLDYGIAQKGRFRGLQNGIAVISILVANTVEPDAIAFAKTHLTRRAGAFAWPVLVDLSLGISYRHEGRVFIGGFFAHWMRDQIDTALPEVHIVPS
jgi:hypothetical protein